MALSRRPCARKRVQEKFIRIAYPQAWLGREPIEAAQPFGGGFKPFVIEDVGLAVVFAGRIIALPFMAVPLPHTFVAFARGKQPEAHRFITQLEGKLRDRRMSHAELVPCNVVFGSLFTAKMRQQTVA